MTPGNARRARLRSVITTQGELVTIGASTRRMVVVPLSPSAARTWMPSADVDALGRPLYAVLTPYDDPLVVGDTLAWAGPILTVIRIAEVRAGAASLARFAVATPPV